MTTQITQIAIQSALKAGEVLKQGFGTAFKISNKEGKNNLVTEYDLLAEKIIIDNIRGKFPDHNFLAEESGYTESGSRGNIRWIIDPLDGTVNFAHGLPIFSVSIAAESNGEVICGVVYHPMLDELFVAVKGQGATLNGNPISVSGTSDIDSSFLITGFPYNVNENPCNCIDLFVDIIKRGIPVRRLGSAALDLAYIAAGRFDGFWEISLNPWDVAAGILLVREAGGQVTQFNGREHELTSESMLATNGRLHGGLVSILTKCRHYL